MEDYNKPKRSSKVTARINERCTYCIVPTTRGVEQSRPMSMSVIDAVVETQPVICQSFHVPFQSGSNKILNTMGRGHTREAYLAIISRIRLKLPDASITIKVFFKKKTCHNEI
jgi:tRNA A37 methylthiotransferase MiaB